MIDTSSIWNRLSGRKLSIIKDLFDFNLEVIVNWSSEHIIILWLLYDCYIFIFIPELSRLHHYHLTTTSRFSSQLAYFGWLLIFIFCIATCESHKDGPLSPGGREENKILRTGLLIIVLELRSTVCSSACFSIWTETYNQWVLYYYIIIAIILMIRSGLCIS